MASTDMAMLANFQKHFEDMRSLIHCKICLKPFYEPFTLPCGHTYCYSCLSSWCTGSHNRGKVKTCPDCRATVTSQPSPNFLLRDLVQMFLTHTELLPEDETIEEHRLGKETEAKLVAADRHGPGLFKGLFHKNRHPFGGARATAIRDEEDGVDRCPLCTHELEDGECSRCGWNEDGDDDSYNSDEDDRDISPIDDFGGPVDVASQDMPYYYGFGPDGHFVGGTRNEGVISSGAYSIDDDNSENGTEYGEDDDDMSSFISNDEEGDLPNEIDEDDESVHTVHGYDEDSPARQYGTESGYMRHTTNVGQNAPPRFHAIDIDEVSDDSDDSEDDNTTITTTTQATDEDSEVVDDSEATNYDSGSSSIREVSPPVIAQPSRANGAKRRRIIEDDDDEDEQDSDDTATRSEQTSNAHVQHSRGHRRLRGNNFHISHMPERRRISLSPDDEPPRQHSRRGSSFRGSAPRRGRPATTRVY